MTVAELIEQLKLVPPQTEVEITGTGGDGKERTYTPTWVECLKRGDGVLFFLIWADES